MFTNVIEANTVQHIAFSCDSHRKSMASRIKLIVDEVRQSARRMIDVSNPPPLYDERLYLEHVYGETVAPQGLHTFSSQT